VTRQIWIPSEDVCDWLRSKYAYDASTGDFSFAETGRPVKLQTLKNGYKTIKLSNAKLNVRCYVLVHRLAWFLHYETFPAFEIDHVDTNKSNNRIDNLRDATHQQNHQHCPKKVKRVGGSFTSRYKGVAWNKRDQIWLVQIKVNRKTIHIGSFKDEREAALAYNEAAMKYFKEFAFINELL
jgi:hypothetical protein